MTINVRTYFNDDIYCTSVIYTSIKHDRIIIATVKTRHQIKAKQVVVVLISRRYMSLYT